MSSTSSGGGGTTAGDAATRSCRTSLTALQLLLGAVLPTLLGYCVNRWVLAAAGGADSGGESGTTGGRASGSSEGVGAAGEPPAHCPLGLDSTLPGWLTAGLAALQRCVCRAEAFLAAACELLLGGTGSRVVVAAAWTLAAAAVWLGALALEQAGAQS